MKTPILICANAAEGCAVLLAICWGTGEDALGVWRALGVMATFGAMVCGGLLAVVMELGNEE